MPCRCNWLMHLEERYARLAQHSKDVLSVLVERIEDVFKKHPCWFWSSFFVQVSSTVGTKYQLHNNFAFRYVLSCGQILPNGLHICGHKNIFCDALEYAQPKRLVGPEAHKTLRTYTSFISTHLLQVTTEAEPIIWPERCCSPFHAIHASSRGPRCEAKATSDSMKPLRITRSPCTGCM